MHGQTVRVKKDEETNEWSSTTYIFFFVILAGNEEDVHGLGPDPFESTPPPPPPLWLCAPLFHAHAALGPVSKTPANTIICDFFVDTYILLNQYKNKLLAAVLAVDW